MGKILDKVNSPADLKKLSKSQLKDLAQEIRDLMIETVSKTGGHLAPNLGVVELTIGLHLVLQSPKDKIIWDVGHQAYVHKLLTGRKDKFSTLRQEGGLSGFPRRAESEHDAFDSGHASTSISVALGLAEARDKKGGDEKIVVVIGDGALTGGVAYEALNQAGHLNTSLIVVLNDNHMSIAKNVGAMASYLTKIRLDPTYNRLKHEIEERLKKIPAIGERMLHLSQHLKEGIKQFLVPGVLFEELGFKYVGPFDGHNIEEVKKSLSLAKQFEGPVLIHVLTEKGKGYLPAARNPEKFHGASPFVVKTGHFRKKNKIPTYTQVFGETMAELARKDERIIAITAAMPSGTGLEDFAESFPNRFYDVGIAEQHAVTFSAGLALNGFLPVNAIYSTFLERAYDQIIQDVALQNLHVIFAVDRAGIVGEDGPTHQGGFDLSYLRHIPRMVIMAPEDEEELRHMLYTATKIKAPVAVRYPRGQGLGVEFSQQFKELVLGKAEVVLENGVDVSLIAVGRMVKVAKEAAESLKKKGILATVVNARFIKPLDRDLISFLAKQSELLVTLEENSQMGGFGSGVLETLAEEGISVPVLNLGFPDRFILHGKPDKLLQELGLDAAGVTHSVEKKLEALRRMKFSFREEEWLDDVIPYTRSEDG
ncbi:MAG TPA: 1-deoxy-D-xylulose-5-phosphate synthase [Candidatus Subteraquimicrobiales bacterium]